MNSLIQRLEYIEEKCGDKKKTKKKDEEKDLDDFTRLRKKIHREVTAVRDQIKGRNELLGESENNQATVKMSVDIRKKLREVNEEVKLLENMQKKEQSKLEDKKAKGKEIDPKVEEEVQVRAEVVELCFKHLEECRNLEKAGFGQSVLSFNGLSKDDGRAPISSLPDIDDEGFQLLKRQDAQIDAKLEEIGKGVAVLKEIAVEMGKEVETQNVMISELDHKVDKAQAQLDNLNKRLKNVLTKVRKGDRFCIDLILLIIVLGLAGYIYNYIRKK